MNLEEGFRRIGVATYLLAIVLAMVAFFGTGSLLLASVVVLAVIIIFHITIYVAKGFLKEKGNGSDKG